jgi:hypothetical protein
MKNIHTWIQTIIESCTDDFHFEAVDRLIDLYREQIKDEDSAVELEMSRANKWNKIHGIVKPELNK